MVAEDKYLKKCFLKPPLTAFRRQNNIRNYLIKSKIAPPPQLHPKRKLKGMSKCGKAFTACPYILGGQKVRIDSEHTWRIEKKLNCESFNIIYLIICKKCNQKYIGTTGRQLKNKLADHGGYIRNQVISRATGAHFNLPGHSLAELQVTILEQTKFNDEENRKEREKYHIRKFDTYNDGISLEW